MRSKYGMYISNFYCTECGVHMELPRNRGRKRSDKHIKTIYCYKCKRETKFEERQEHGFKEDIARLF